jgi:hypothetical protein
MANPNIAGFSTIGLEGADYTATYTGYAQSSAVSSTNNPDYPSPTGQYSLGQVSKGADGSEWVYALAGSNITLGDVVILTNTGALWTADSVTNTLAASKLGAWLGVQPFTAVTSGQYAWFQRAGKCAGINIIASTTKNVLLYTTTTAGKLSSASVASTTSIMAGVVLTTAATTATAQAMLNFPVVGVTQ